MFGLCVVNGAKTINLAGSFKYSSVEDIEAAITTTTTTQPCFGRVRVTVRGVHCSAFGGSRIQSKPRVLT